MKTLRNKLGLGAPMLSEGEQETLKTLNAQRKQLNATCKWLWGQINAPDAAVRGGIDSEKKERVQLEWPPLQLHDFLTYYMRQFQARIKAHEKLKPEKAASRRSTASLGWSQFPQFGPEEARSLCKDIKTVWDACDYNASVIRRYVEEMEALYRRIGDFADAEERLLCGSECAQQFKALEQSSNASRFVPLAASNATAGA